MSLRTKITVIGAGSASFGENTLSAIMRSKKLCGSMLALVDKNAETLGIVHRLANRLNREWDAQFTITSEGDKGELSYIVPGQKVVNVFNLFDYPVDVTTTVSASTGEVLLIDEPIWLKVLGFALI